MHTLNVPAVLTDVISEFLDSKEWRPLDVVVCQHKTITSFGDFIPLFTNGIITVIKICRNEFHCTVHHDQIVFPDKKSPCKMHTDKKPSKPRQRAYKLDDI